MTALKAGAVHVTAVERWLYLSLACKETVAANGFDDSQCTVLYKRPTDLVLHQDVRICCNLLVCDMFEEGMPSSFSCTKGSALLITALHASFLLE